MEIQFNKLVVLTAILLMFGESRATSRKLSRTDQKINYALSEIVNVAKADSSILMQILMSDKSYLENELQVLFSDIEYEKIRIVVGKLVTYGLNIQFVPVEDMVLASQELLGGGANK